MKLNLNQVSHTATYPCHTCQLDRTRAYNLYPLHPIVLFNFGTLITSFFTSDSHGELVLNHSDTTMKLATDSTLLLQLVDKDNGIWGYPDSLSLFNNIL